jgi:hypothetical protein
VASWEEFEQTKPELARATRERFERSGIGFLGSVRRDGSPRVTALEVYFVDGRLCLQMLWRTTKALDLLRDGRCVLHTSVHGRDDPGGEYKVRGRAIEVNQPRLRRKVSDAIHALWKWRPTEPNFHVF